MLHGTSRSNFSVDRDSCSTNDDSLLSGSASASGRTAALDSTPHDSPVPSNTPDRVFNGIICEQKPWNGGGDSAATGTNGASGSRINVTDPSLNNCNFGGGSHGSRANSLGSNDAVASRPQHTVVNYSGVGLIRNSSDILLLSRPRLSAPSFFGRPFSIPVDRSERRNWRRQLKLSSSPPVGLPSRDVFNPPAFEAISQYYRLYSPSRRDAAAAPPGLAIAPPPQQSHYQQEGLSPISSDAKLDASTTGPQNSPRGSSALSEGSRVIFYSPSNFATTAQVRPANSLFSEASTPLAVSLKLTSLLHHGFSSSVWICTSRVQSLGSNPAPPGQILPLSFQLNHRTTSNCIAMATPSSLPEDAGRGTSEAGLLQMNTNNSPATESSHCSKGAWPLLPVPEKQVEAPGLSSDDPDAYCTSDSSYDTKRHERLSSDEVTTTSIRVSLFWRNVSHDQVNLHCDCGSYCDGSHLPLCPTAYDSGACGLSGTRSGWSTTNTSMQHGMPTAFCASPQSAAVMKKRRRLQLASAGEDGVIDTVDPQRATDESINTSGSRRRRRTTRRLELRRFGLQRLALRHSTNNSRDPQPRYESLAICSPISAKQIKFPSSSRNTTTRGGYSRGGVTTTTTTPSGPSNNRHQARDQSAARSDHTVVAAEHSLWILDTEERLLTPKFNFRLSHVPKLVTLKSMSLPKRDNITGGALNRALCDPRRGLWASGLTGRGRPRRLAVRGPRRHSVVSPGLSLPTCLPMSSDGSAPLLPQERPSQSAPLDCGSVVVAPALRKPAGNRPRLAAFTCSNRCQPGCETCSTPRGSIDSRSRFARQWRRRNLEDDTSSTLVVPNTIVLKVIHKCKCSADELKRLTQEVEFLKRFKHPHILTLLSYSESKTEQWLLFERAPLGDLYRVTSFKVLPEHVVRWIVFQLLLGLDYLHCNQHIIHCDVKPHNLLLFEDPEIYALYSNPSDAAVSNLDGGHRVSRDESEGACAAADRLLLTVQLPAGSSSTPSRPKRNGLPQWRKIRLKLCDFGLACRPEAWNQPVEFDGLRGTHGFFPPELLQRRPYSYKVDMWAAGVIAFTLIAGYEPFYPCAVCIKEDVEFDSRYWSSASPEAKDFIRALLQRNPDDRLSTKQALEHDWIKRYFRIPPTWKADGGKDLLQSTKKS